MFTHSIEKAKNFVIVVGVRGCTPCRTGEKTPSQPRGTEKNCKGVPPLHEMVNHLMHPLIDGRRSLFVGADGPADWTAGVPSCGGADGGPAGRAADAGREHDPGSERHGAVVLAEPDVLFLEAAHGGMELASELQTEADPLPVVLLADNYEQVLDGYRLSVKRCLMMPPERERLEEILRFCRGAYGRKSFRVPLPSGETCVIQLGEILWSRGLGHKILIYMEGRAGPLELWGAVPQLERILPGSFVRCHHSTTVNTDKIRTLERTAAVLTDGSRVPVSRRKHELVRSRYMASTRLCMQEGRVL